MIPHLEPRRPLTTEERDALAHLPSHPVEDYAATLSAVKQIEGQWTWEYRSLEAHRTYSTAELALEAFEARLIDLIERERAERPKRKVSADQPRVIGPARA